MGKLLDLLVRRAVPPNLLDPEQERIAAEAAENGIRSTAWMAIIPSILLLALVGLVAMRGTSPTPASPPMSAASQTARVLSSENAQLRLGSEELQKRLDDLTKERADLYGQVADLQKRVADAGSAPAVPPPTAAVADAAAPVGQQPSAHEPSAHESTPPQAAQAAKTPEPPPTTERPAAKPAARPEPSPAAERPAPKSAARPEPPVKLAAAPRPAPVPAGTLAPPIAQSTPSQSTYSCRDGRTVREASDCENVTGGSSSLAGAASVPDPQPRQTVASLPPSGPRAQFVVEIRQEVPGGPAVAGQPVAVNFYDGQRNVINSTGWTTNGEGRTPVFTAPAGTAYFQVVGPDDISYAWPGNGHVLEVNATKVDPARGLVIVRFLTR